MADEDLKLSEDEVRLIQVRRELMQKGMREDEATKVAQKAIDSTVTPLAGGFSELNDRVLESAFDLLDEGLSPQEVRKQLRLRPRDMARVMAEYNRLQALDRPKQQPEEDLISIYKKSLMEAQKIKAQQQAMKDAGLVQGEEKKSNMDQNALLMLMMFQNQQRPQEKQLSPVELLSAYANIVEKLQGKQATVEDTLSLIRNVLDLRDQISPRETQTVIPVQPTQRTLAEMIGEKVGGLVEKNIVDSVASRIEEMITKRPEAIKEPTFQDQVRGVLEALDNSRVGQAIIDDLIPTVSQWAQAKLSSTVNTQPIPGYVPGRTEAPPDVPTSLPSATPTSDSGSGSGSGSDADNQVSE